MRQLRGWMIWAALSLCALMVLAIMTSFTRSAIHSERRRAWAEDRVDMLKNVSFALRLMDGVGTAWISDESQHSAIAADTGSEPKPEVLLRFEAREDDDVISINQSREDSLRRALRLGANETLFRHLDAAMSPTPAGWESPPLPSPPEPVSKALDANSKGSYRGGADPAAQQWASSKEREVRQRALNMALEQSQQPEKVAKNSIFSNWQLTQAGMPQPVTIGGQLFLLRHLKWRMPMGNDVGSIQGVWIDADRLQAKLLTEIRDIFPYGKFQTATPGGGNVDCLVCFPFWKFDPGLPPENPAELPQTFSLTLKAGWAVTLGAIAAASLLVRGVMRLSERRASFVSAVTHELRTPLTTFRLYSEMLESGAVREEKRSDYLKILSREADRLSHLVENVLAFSRIERGSARTAVRETSLRDLLESLRERFEARLNIAGMDLRMGLDEPAAAYRIKADAAVVEHILFNLVDNAARYASSGNPPELSIRVIRKANHLAILVEDWGPGIPPAKRNRIFQPFHKSARDAAESKPGVGLGLALSQRLARSLGGDLRYERRRDRTGACFQLHLPLPWTTGFTGTGPAAAPASPLSPPASGSAAS